MAAPPGGWPNFTFDGVFRDSKGNSRFTGRNNNGVVGEDVMVFDREAGVVRLYTHSFQETYLSEKTLTGSSSGGDSMPGDLSGAPDGPGFDYLNGWQNVIGTEPIIKNGGPNPGYYWDHTDTPAVIYHPASNLWLCFNHGRPGTRQFIEGSVGGYVGCITISHIQTPAIAVPWTTEQEPILIADLPWEEGFTPAGSEPGFYRGGLAEPSVIEHPETGRLRLFYRGMTNWIWAYSYADCVGEDPRLASSWVKEPVPFFDPSAAGNIAQTFLPYQGAYQAHAEVDPRTGGVHFVIISTNPQNPGGGAIHHLYNSTPGADDPAEWDLNPNGPWLFQGSDADHLPAGGIQKNPIILVDLTLQRYLLIFTGGPDFLPPRFTFGASASIDTLSGSSSIGLTTSGHIVGRIKTSGASAFGLSTSGSLKGKGKLSGSASIGLGASTPPLGAKGMLRGAAELGVAGAGSLKGSGKLSGSSSISFAASGTRLASGMVAGSSSIGLAASGSLKGTGKLSGSATIGLAGSGSAKGAGKLSGSTSIAIAPAASLTATGKLSGSASIGIGASGGVMVMSSSERGASVIRARMTHTVDLYKAQHGKTGQKKSANWELTNSDEPARIDPLSDQPLATVLGQTTTSLFRGYFEQGLDLDVGDKIVWKDRTPNVWMRVETVQDYSGANPYQADHIEATLKEIDSPST